MESVTKSALVKAGTVFLVSKVLRELTVLLGALGINVVVALSVVSMGDTSKAAEDVSRPVTSLV